MVIRELDICLFVFDMLVYFSLKGDWGNVNPSREGIK